MPKLEQTSTGIAWDGLVRGACMSARADAERWESRHGGATIVRLLVFLGPVVLALGVAWVVHSYLPPMSGWWGRLGTLAILTPVSTAVLVLTDKVSRKLLPLVTLLELSILFPDKAPLRLRVARDAIRRRPIEEQLERLRAVGADPVAAATEILTLIASLSTHDRPTRGHAERVRMFTELLAVEIGLPERDRDLLRWTAILHDIGKLAVPASILNKPGKPSEKEWEALRAHPLHGAQIAAPLLPWLGEWGSVIIQHHERYDGTGYPEGLSGNQISRGARIVSVADAYDVMTAVRSYRRPVSRKAALRELVRFSGTQFDPVVVRAMVGVGVPRLRRAQGVVAWLGGIPIVASNAVPAATLARVVGSGALVTGSVAGIAVPVVAAQEKAPHEASVVVSAENPAARPSNLELPVATQTQDRKTASEKQREPKPGDGKGSDAGTGTDVGPGEGPGVGADPSGSGGQDPSDPDTGDDAGSNDGTAGPVAGTATTTVKNGVQSVTKAVETVKDTVDETTDTVEGVVEDVVEDSTGVVRGVRDGLGLGG